jgi:hypothetical protein
LSTEFDPAAGRALFKAEQTPAMQAARQTEVFQDFLTFAPFVSWHATPASDSENAVRVEAADLRFGAGFIATAIVEGNRVVRAWFSF